MELKVKPTVRHIQSIFLQGNEVRLHTGVRGSESFDRAKLVEREMDEKFLCEVFRPLLKWTLNDVWAILKRHNIPRNPLYDHGAKRVGCLPCVMSRKSEIRLIADEFPETIDNIRNAESDPLFPGGGSGFFRSAMIPKRFHSRVYIREKDGKQFMVPTIDDVVRWANTEWGGEQVMAGRDPLQPTLEFLERHLSSFSGDTAGGCNSNVGFCE